MIENVSNFSPNMTQNMYYMKNVSKNDNFLSNLCLTSVHFFHSFTPSCFAITLCFVAAHMNNIYSLINTHLNNIFCFSAFYFCHIFSLILFFSLPLLGAALTSHKNATLVFYS